MQEGGRAPFQEFAGVLVLLRLETFLLEYHHLEQLGVANRLHWADVRAGHGLDRLRACHRCGLAARSSRAAVEPDAGYCQTN